MELKLSDKNQYLNHGAILLKAIGGGIRVLWTHISSSEYTKPVKKNSYKDD